MTSEKIPKKCRQNNVIVFDMQAAHLWYICKQIDNEIVAM